MGGVAASGGYYIAMAVGPGENLIYAEPTTTTGSIGVIIPNYNITGLLDKFGVKDESIKSHPLKDMLSMTRPMTDEEELILQDYVDESFRRFKRVILATRPQLKGTAADSLQDPQTEKDLATGQIFTADQAMQSQLIDQIGFVEDAVARIRELAGLTDRNSKVVEYRRPFSLSGMLGVASAPDRIEHDARPQAEFWAATAPQAYYLSTTIPPLMSSLPLAK
jgi:protease-4